MKILAELIREAGIKKRYFLYGRSDTIVRNPELIKLWKDIGLERIFVGLNFSGMKTLNILIRVQLSKIIKRQLRYCIQMA